MYRTQVHVPHSTYTSLLRLIFSPGVLLILAMLTNGCAALKRSHDEVDIEKLRLQYQDGKMNALLQIIEIYEDPEQALSVRVAAARAMGESRHPKAVDALARNIREAELLNLDMVYTSIEELSRIPSHASARALTQALTTTDAKLTLLRNKLIEGLETIGSEDYVQTLIDLYQASRENHLRMEQTLTKVLGQLGDDKAIPVLIDIATNPEVSLTTRSTAIEILAQKESPEVVQLFAEMLGDPATNLQVRDFALQAMGEIKEERLVMALLETYILGKEEYYSLLNTLLKTLGEFDDPAIRPTMMEIVLSDEFPLSFRRQAIANLANFKDPSVLDRVIPLLEDPANYGLYDEIASLTETLQPGPTGKERLRRAALRAMANAERGD